MKKLRNSLILGSLTAFVIVVTVVVFACSKQTEEISEDTIKTEKSANIDCTRPPVQMPIDCCFEVCVDCDKNFRDFINTGTHGRPAMEWTVTGCDGNTFTVHFEYFGPPSMSERDIRNPANWLWARDQNGAPYCSCAGRIPCADKPDDIKDAWFAAIATLCGGKFRP